MRANSDHCSSLLLLVLPRLVLRVLLRMPALLTGSVRLDVAKYPAILPFRAPALVRALAAQSLGLRR